MKKTIMTWLLCLLCSQLFAQCWIVDYEGYPAGITMMTDGLLDEEGVTFLVGQEGESHEKSEALLMRIEPNGSHCEYLHHKEHCHTKATCIVELEDHHLFVAGNCIGETDDSVMVLIFDKQLNLLYERYYSKEVEAVAFGECRATLDSHGHVIVSTTVKQVNSYQITEHHGVFFKFDGNGDMLSRRYLIEEYPSPLFYMTQFHLRQMWVREENTLLCLAPGYGGIMSFITFDSAFNYLEEHPIYQDKREKSDHVLCNDCYTDYWYSDEEALVFSGLCDEDHNRLRVSRINTQGEYLEYIHLNVRKDTTDNPANRRCMAAANDSTFYFSFYYHPYSYDPGVACVYLLNGQLEIIGRHLDDDIACYRSRLILSTHDGGCITVNCINNCQGLVQEEHPFIQRLTKEDFETVTWAIPEPTNDPQRGGAYPNPTSTMLHIPLDQLVTHEARCCILDQLGRTVSDVKIDPKAEALNLNVASLKPGQYLYRIYSHEKTLLTAPFIKQ